MRIIATPEYNVKISCGPLRRMLDKAGMSLISVIAALHALLPFDRSLGYYMRNVISDSGVITSLSPYRRQAHDTDEAANYGDERYIFTLS